MLATTVPEGWYEDVLEVLLRIEDVVGLGFGLLIFGVMLFGVASWWR